MSRWEDLTRWLEESGKLCDDVEQSVREAQSLVPTSVRAEVQEALARRSQRR